MEKHLQKPEYSNDYVSRKKEGIATGMLLGVDTVEQ